MATISSYICESVGDVDVFCYSNRLLILTYHYPKHLFLQTFTNFELAKLNITCRHSNLNFADRLFSFLQNGTNKNPHHQRGPIHDKFVIFANLVRQENIKMMR